MTMSNTMHVAVLGCGPAGASAAHACALAGLETVIVDPSPDALWPNRYGVWCEDWPEALHQFTHQWPCAVVIAESTHRLERAYGIVDRRAVADALRAEYVQAGGRVCADRAVSLRGEPGAFVVELASGAQLSVGAIVDARGASAPCGAPSLFQTAWGGEVAASLPLDPAVMHLMDFRAPGRSVGPPSFLYAYALDEGRWFLEETVLAGPAVPFASLRARLGARLEAWGVSPEVLAEATEIEECRIPMDVGAYEGPKGVIPFGAAAGLVHPATGYSVATTLRLAPQIPALVHQQRDPARAVDRPDVRGADALAADALYRFGGAEIARFDQARQRAFFEAFFHLPEPLRNGYLSRTLGPRGVGRAMWGVFCRTSSSTRRILTSAGLQHASVLARALLTRSSVSSAPVPLPLPVSR
jgi:lycopene beta-cyclase